MNNWELDALEPRLIDRLIHNAVHEYIDHEMLKSFSMGPRKQAWSSSSC